MNVAVYTFNLPFPELGVSLGFPEGVLAAAAAVILLLVVGASSGHGAPGLRRLQRHGAPLILPLPQVRLDRLQQCTASVFLTYNETSHPHIVCVCEHLD